MSRLEVTPDELGSGLYPMINACVVPRPIAWVSTRSAAGVDNIAPHSYFTVSSVRPPVVQFTSVGHKDTLRNVRETGEFVVCVGSRELARAVNHTATDFAPDESEFDETALVRAPSVHVAPPRAAAAPVALECRAVGERDFGGSVVTFGEVVCFVLDPAVLDADGRPDIDVLAPVSRLGGNAWGTVGETFDLARIPVARWRDGER